MSKEKRGRVGMGIIQKNKEKWEMGPSYGKLRMAMRSRGQEYVSI